MLAALLELRSGACASAASGTTPSNSLGRSMPVWLADPELARLALDHGAVAVGALADFEEVGVGGDLQRLHEPDGAVFGVPGVAELLGRDVDALARAEPFRGRDHAAFERAPSR